MDLDVTKSFFKMVKEKHPELDKKITAMLDEVRHEAYIEYLSKLLLSSGQRELYDKGLYIKSQGKLATGTAKKIADAMLEYSDAMQKGK